MNLKGKEQSDKIIELENHKKCYIDNINYLETKLKNV